MVEVFKTNVNEADEAQQLVSKLLICFPEAKITFALDDCDKILRVEHERIDVEKTVELLNVTGYECEVLE